MANHAPLFGWTRYELRFQAAASATQLRFGYTTPNTDAPWDVDDISLGDLLCTLDADCGSPTLLCSDAVCTACSAASDNW